MTENKLTVEHNGFTASYYFRFKKYFVIETNFNPFNSIDFFMDMQKPPEVVGVQSIETTNGNGTVIIQLRTDSPIFDEFDFMTKFDLNFKKHFDTI
ncbi:MAG: hypothetical protein RIS29_2517 [Bacteroidota bacterium]|jgi:hypothetical protein